MTWCASYKPFPTSERCRQDPLLGAAKTSMSMLVWTLSCMLSWWAWSSFSWSISVSRRLLAPFVKRWQHSSYYCRMLVILWSRYRLLLLMPWSFPLRMLLFSLTPVSINHIWLRRNNYTVFSLLVVVPTRHRSLMWMPPLRERAWKWSWRRYYRLHQSFRSWSLAHLRHWRWPHRPSHHSRPSLWIVEECWCIDLSVFLVKSFMDCSLV
jgi:hypothetical protein